MAFPYLFHANFEAGVATEFTGTGADTDSKGAVKHYAYLARFPYVDFVPYRGAYAYRVDLSLGTNDCYLQEDTGFDTSAAGTIWIRFYLWVGQLTMATSDRFTIFALQSGAGTDEATIGIINNAGTIQFVFGETGATAVGSCKTTDLIQNQWHCIEMKAVIDSGVGNDGTITAFVDGNQIGTAITALDQGAITQARLGAIGIDAGTTRGLLLFDEVIADDGQVGTLSRSGEMRYGFKTAHLALGQGQINNVTLLGGNADNVLTLWDTDRAEVTDTSKIIFGPIAGAGAVSAVNTFMDDTQLYYNRGVYAVMSGTNPRASIRLYEANDMCLGDVKTLGNSRV